MFFECKGLQHRYGRRTTLDIESLALHAGKITAVIGPNGAGKTTLLEIIALLRHPYKGQLRHWGQPSASKDRDLRRSIVMSMHPGYLFHGTVWRNVLWGLRARGVPRRISRRQAAHALEMLELTDLARQDVTKLSAGQRQRVNIARAVALHPRAMLLDEPTANTDARSTECIQHVLQWLRGQAGTTIVHTSPWGNCLEAITDHVIELVDGRVVAEDRSGPRPDALHLSVRDSSRRAAGQ